MARFSDDPTPANLEYLFHPSFKISPDDLRKTILTLAVQGKLVEQDPEEESGKVLQNQIILGRENLLSSFEIRKSKPCKQMFIEDSPHIIPKSWVWMMLGEIADIGTGSTPTRTNPSFWEGGSVPWITSGATSQSPIESSEEFVTLEAVKAHRLRIYEPGTLLVALYGQGKTRGQVASLEISATINQACAAICPLKGFHQMQEFIKIVLEKQYDEMRLLAAGGAQPNLNVQKIKELLVPLPPIGEQGRIVAKIKEMMALVDQLKDEELESLRVGSNLVDAMLAEFGR